MYELPTFLADFVSFYDVGGWLQEKIGALTGWLSGIFAPLPSILLIVFGLIVMLFGKKILPVLKFLLFAELGFGLGFVATPYLAGLFGAEWGEIVSIVVGGVCALLLAVFCKYLYVILFKLLTPFAAGFLGVYALIANVPAVAEALSASAALPVIVEIVGGIVVVLLLWWIFKFIEMLVTSLDGASYAVVGIIGLYDFNVALNWGSVTVAETLVFPIALLVVIGVLTLIGFIVQVKTRRLY